MTQELSTRRPLCVAEPASGARAHRAPERPLVSAVVIARDEAKTIGASIRATIESLAGYRSDVVVVDCGSKDATGGIAAAYPVRLVSMAQGAPLRPAVARHIGLRFALGEYVLFVDGDTVLEPSWLREALREMMVDPKLAGVAGACIGVDTNAGTATTLDDQYPDAEYESPSWLSGSALYRRSALSRAGGFNPHLRSSEEIELGARLRAAGFVLRRLRVCMGRHHRKAQRESVHELLRRMKRRYPVGLGQLARHAVVYTLPIPSPYSHVSRHVCFTGLLALGPLAGIWSLRTGTRTLLLVWLAAMVGVFAVFAVRSRSLAHPAYYFLEWTLTGPMVLWGLIMKPLPTAAFREPETTVRDLSAQLADDETVTAAYTASAVATTAMDR